MSETIVLQLLVTVAFGGLVGVALGLTGGGGSIFAVPILIYGLGVAPANAMAISLVAVTATAIVGTIQSLRYKLIVWQPSLLFALGGIAGAPTGAAVAHQVESSWLTAGFALLALTVGLLMWHVSRAHPEQATAVRAQSLGAGNGPICVLAPDGQLRFTAPCAIVLAIIGVATGFLSGLFGVGGGFIIVPALVLVTRMGVHRAVATSLFVISVIGAAGATGVIWHDTIAWKVLLPFAAGGALMMFATRLFAARIAGPRLQRVLAVAIVAVGVSMLVENLL
jgi:uncharacterized membrane protein YfcA